MTEKRLKRDSSVEHIFNAMNAPRLPRGETGRGAEMLAI